MWIVCEFSIRWWRSRDRWAMMEALRLGEIKRRWVFGHCAEVGMASRVNTRAELRECYRKLGLPVGSSLAEVKAAYRKLARQYHPDANRSGAAQSQTQDQFIQVTEAYRMLMEHGHQITGERDRRTRTTRRTTQSQPKSQSTAERPSPKKSTAKSQPKVRVQSRPTPKAKRKVKISPNDDMVTGVDPSKPRQQPKVWPKVELNPELSSFDQELKEKTYKRLKALLASRRFPSAIAMSEALASRIPQDPEAKQWLAISYHRWGRELIDRREPDKARIFLKKALHTDPHNRELWVAIDHEFQRIERG
ncbi:MAG: DnaJ domain-containing protein [Cyanobacteria bacterium P01_D01_bin.73]